MADTVDARLVAWRLMLQTHRSLLPALGEELAEAAGLPLTAYDVLLHLGEAPGRRLRMSTLADRVLLSPSGVSRVVDRLQAGGLVTREPDPSDRRAAFALLTERGVQVLRTAAPVHLEGIARHFTDHLSQGEAETIAAAFRRILERQGVDVDEQGRRKCG